MAMEEVIARGKVVLEAESNLEAETRRAVQEWKATVKRLEAQEADLRININVKKSEIKQAQAEIKKFENARRRAQRKGDQDAIASANEVLVKRRLALKKLEAAHKKLEDNLSQMGDRRVAEERKNNRIVVAAREKVVKAKAALAKAEAKAEKEALDEVAKAEADANRESLARDKRAAAERAKTRERGLAHAKDVAKRRVAAEKAAIDEEEAYHRRSVERQERLETQHADAQRRMERQRLADKTKAIEQADALENRAIKLADRRERMLRQSRRAFTSPAEKTRIEFDIRDLDRTITEIGAQLALADRTLPKINPVADDRQGTIITKWGKAITSASIRLGPFTTSVGGAFRALAILGPAITGVVGTLGALVGVLGSATVGFIGLGTAMGGAFGTVLGSTALLLPKLLNDFKNLNTIQNAYHTAVLKYGAASDQAKAKLKQFNNALGEVPPTTLKTFEAIDKLSNRFDKLSEQARPAFFESLAELTKTGNFVITRFGKEILQSFELVSKGVNAASKSLRSAEAQSIFQDFFDFGQKALPSFGRGLANLAASAGRVAAAFSRMLPSFGRGFEEWTEGVVRYTRNGPKMVSLVDRTSRSLRSLGGFLRSAVGFIAAFFDQGVRPGTALLDDMAAGLDRVSQKIRSGDSLEDFFGDSINTTKNLYEALKPLVALFIEWSTIMRPFTDIMLEVLGALAKLTALVAGWGPMRHLIQAAFAVFLGRALVSNISAAANAMRVLAIQSKAAVTSMLAAQGLSRFGAGTAVGGAVVGGRGVAGRGITGRGVSVTGAPLPGMAATGAQAGTAAKNLTKFGSAARYAKAGLTGVGAVLGVANPLFGAAVLGVGAAAIAYGHFSGKAEDLRKNLESARQEVKDSVSAYNSLSTITPDVVSQHEYAKIAVEQARKALKAAKKGTDEYRLAQLQLRDAQRNLHETHRQENKALSDAIELSRRRAAAARRERDAWKAVNQDEMDRLRGQIARSKGTVFEGSRSDLLRRERLNQLEREYAEIQAKVTRQINAQHTALLNNMRARRGMSPIRGRNAQAVGQLYERNPEIATRLALRFPNPARVAREARKLLSSLPDMSFQIKVGAKLSDFRTIERNFATLNTSSNLSLRAIKTNSDQTMKAIRNSMGLHTKAGKEAAADNFRATAGAIERSMSKGAKDTSTKLRAIRQSFKTNTHDVKANTQRNFQAAKEAIENAVRRGVISSERGSRQINKLWAAQLSIYGFSPAEARRWLKSPTGDTTGRNEGRSGIRPTTDARGGLHSVGHPGVRGNDNVPAVLNGENALIAKGEQVAVFNRHQQQAMDQMIPGGLSGFFSRNNRPHYMSKGGQIGTAFAGRVRTFGVGGMVAAANQLEKAQFPYVWGGGHQATPAPFGPMDCSGAVSYVLQHGGVGIPTMVSGALMNAGQPGPGVVTVYANPEHTLMSIAGRFFGTSGSNPGGGAGWIPKPSSAYLSRFVQRHFDTAGADIFGGVGGIEVPKISDAVQGVMRPVVQGVLKGITGAANESLTQMSAAFLGGGDANNPIGGSGRASRAQMVAWARQALSITGVGATAGNIASILELAMKESGWVVDSFNNWDSNAKAGNPSGGLMHVTIDKVGGSMARLFNPVANMVASIKYQIAQYGHLVTHSPYARGGIAQGTRQSFDTMDTGGAGGTIKKPTLMMGEEPSKEFDISTNPAYKKSNIERLSTAARMLGIGQARDGFTPAGTLANPVPKTPGNVPKFPKKPKRRTPKRRKKAYRRGGSWRDYIEKLEFNKGVLEQVVAFRQADIEEPSDLMIEQGRITDPITGEDYGPKMVENVGAIETYVNAINHMLVAYTALQSVVNALLEAMPKARTAWREEKKWRNHNIAVLKARIKKDEKAASQGGKKHKESREAAQARLKKDKPRLNSEITARDDINTDLETLKDDEVGYFFEKKEIDRDIDEYRGDASSIMGETAAEATAENERTLTEGQTGGAGSAGPTLAQQNTMADSERANILREFGGNTAALDTPFRGGTLGGSLISGGGAGIQANLGGLTSVSGSAASAFMSSGTAAGATVAGLSGISSPGATAFGGTGDKNVTIINNNSFLEPAPDPHQYIQGLTFEANAIV